jgi:hypothetical protein
MAEQNPLIQLLGLEQQSVPSRRQLGPPPPPPPPPAAKQQSSDTAFPLTPAPATANQLAADFLGSQPMGAAPVRYQAAHSQPLASESLAAQPLAAQPLVAKSLSTQPFASQSPTSPHAVAPEASGPEPQADGSRRRQFDRKPMPFGGVAPVGELTNSTGQKWHISLWDVSMGGLCVMVDSPIDDALGSLLSMSIYESFGLGSAFFNAYLRWRTTEADNTYLGLEFEDQDLLKNGCFLIDYVNTDLAAS